MTGAQITLILAIGTPAVGVSAYVSKLVGDTLWVPIGSYQQEKLYDLEDKAFDYEQQKKYDGALTPREQEKLDRLLKRIERLRSEIE